MFPVNREAMVRLLKGVQDGVEADALVDGAVGVRLEPVEEFALVEVVKGVHDFIGKTNKTVDGIDGFPL